MTPLFGPGWGNYSIQGIVEVQLPESVSLRPQTPGWWILLAVLLFWGGYRAWLSWRHYQRNRYRREALQHLQVLQEQYRAGDGACLRELAPLLRATALQAAGNRELASARGDDWQGALQDLAPGLSPPPVAELNALAYARLPDTVTEPDTVRDLEALFDRLRLWIQHHELSDA